MRGRHVAAVFAPGVIECPKCHYRIVSGSPPHTPQAVVAARARTVEVPPRRCQYCGRWYDAGKLTMAGMIPMHTYPMDGTRECPGSRKPGLLADDPRPLKKDDPEEEKARRLELLRTTTLAEPDPALHLTTRRPGMARAMNDGSGKRSRTVGRR